MTIYHFVGKQDFSYCIINKSQWANINYRDFDLFFNFHFIPIKYYCLLLVI